MTNSNLEKRIDLAIKLSKIIHDKCKEVPHDIGIILENIVESAIREAQIEMLENIISKLRMQYHPDKELLEHRYKGLIDYYERKLSELQMNDKESEGK